MSKPKHHTSAHKKPLTTIPTIDYGAASERTLFSGKGPVHKERRLYGRRTQKTT
jgi:hypothetical protein